MKKVMLGNCGGGCCARGSPIRANGAAAAMTNAAMRSLPCMGFPSSAFDRRGLVEAAKDEPCDCAPSAQSLSPSIYRVEPIPTIVEALKLRRNPKRSGINHNPLNQLYPRSSQYPPV